MCRNQRVPCVGFLWCACWQCRVFFLWKISICFTHFCLVLIGGSLLCWVLDSNPVLLTLHGAPVTLGWLIPQFPLPTPIPMWPPSYTEFTGISRLFLTSPFWLVELFLYFDVTHFFFFFNSCSLFRIILDVGGTSLFLNCCVSLFLDEFYDQLSSSVMGDPASLWRSLAGSWCWAVPPGSFCQRVWRALGVLFRTCPGSRIFGDSTMKSNFQALHSNLVYFAVVVVCVYAKLLGFSYLLAEGFSFPF